MSVLMMNAEYACELAYKRAEPRNSFVFFYPFFHFFFSSLFLKNKRRTNLFLYYFNFLFQLLLSSSLFSFTLLFSKMGYKYYDAHQISVSLFPLSSFSLSLSLDSISLTYLPHKHMANATQGVISLSKVADTRDVALSAPVLAAGRATP